jgi:hypothetical protein
LRKLPEGLTAENLLAKTVSELEGDGYRLNSIEQYWDSDYKVYYFDPKTTKYIESLFVPEVLYQDTTDEYYTICGNLSDIDVCNKLNAQIKDARVKKFKAGTLLEQLSGVQFQTGTDINNNPTYKSFDDL